jgi:ABC-type glycerol-3-phosphate transport system substrate-binding protein
MPRLALLLVALTALTACGGSSTGEDSAAPSTTPEASPAAAIELVGRTLDGEQLSLADLRGTPVFVNVWASW